MPGKRGNGEGSIYRRKDGRWAGQYLVYTTDGPKYRYIYGKTRADVSRKLTKAMADRDGGFVFDAGNLTVETYMARWLSDSVKGTVRISTYERHEQLFRGLIPRNAADVKAPRPAPDEMRPLSESEARAFLDRARGDRFESLYVLAITTGLRRGELLGLRWDDADLERGTLRVGRALVREGGRHTLGETKTKRGRRQVNLTPRTVAALKAHRKRQLEERVKLAGLYEDQGLVFATNAGTPINPENLVKRSFKPLLKKAGLPEIRFHDLRHTCATLLLSRNVHPKIVQEMLGHATIAITLDTYSHVLPGIGDQAAKEMESALS